MPTPSRAKVAIVVSQFPAPSETFVVRRVAALVERGWDVLVVCERSPSEVWSWFPELGALRDRVRVRRRAPSRARVLLDILPVLVRCLRDAPGRTLRYLVGGVRAWGRGVAGHIVEDEPLVRFGPDILHFEFANLAVNREAVGRLLRCALVASLQGYDVAYVGLEHEPGYYARLWSALDAAHLVSDDLLGRARRRGLGSGVPVFVVPNGIEIETFTPPERHAEDVGGADRPLRLLSVGRLHWKKGYGYALDAVRRLRGRGIHVDYHIVGDGDGADAVRYDVVDLGLEDCVKLLGAQPPDRVRAELAWADVFVHAAVSEGFGLAPAEAQAMGVPVVVTDAEGLSATVEDGGTGFVVPRRDAGALADRMALLAGDAELRVRMGKAGAERVRRLFTLERHVAGIEEMYWAVLGRTAG